MIKDDDTFNETSLYGSRKWCAAVLGKSYDWFLRNADNLESDGFPKTDPLTGNRIKEDVYAWINSRRRIEDRVKVETPKHTKENFNAL